VSGKGSKKAQREQRRIGSFGWDAN